MNEKDILIINNFHRYYSISTYTSTRYINYVIRSNVDKFKNSLGEGRELRCGGRPA